MSRMLLLLLLQGGPIARIFDKPIDNTYVLSLYRSLTPPNVSLRLVIAEQADRSRSWELERLDTKYHYSVVRADHSSVVLFRTNDNGFDNTYLKIFFDAASKKVLKRTPYVDTGLPQISDADAQRALGITPELVQRLKTPFEPKPLP